MSTRLEATRERILEAARELLATRGYNGAGVEEIARAAGITRQAIYLHHFASKAELLVALLDHVDRVEGVAALFAPIQKAKTGAEALRRLVSAVADLWPRVGDLARVLDGARSTDQAAELAWESRAQLRRRGVEGLMDRLKRERVLARGWTVPTATDLALGLLSAPLHRMLVAEFGWTRAQYVRHMEALLSTALIR